MPIPQSTPASEEVSAPLEPHSALLPAASPPPLEVELKLSVSPEDGRKLGRIAAIKATARARAVTRKMYSVYYDTPDLDLKKDGVALRLRRERKRWVQTLKGGGRVEAGLHQRVELEKRVPTQLLDYRALAESGLSEVFADPARRARLQPAFTADYTRTSRHLAPDAGSDIELCFDVGTISAGEASAPISEVELELKSGAPAQLIECALLLLEHIALRLEPRSKAERGYALVEGRQAEPVKADAPALEPQMSVTEGFRAVVFSCLTHLQANENGVIALADAEYLHQARVALRRLRSAFSVFRRAFPEAVFEEVLAELRWLGSCLGPARDWDVFALTTLPQIADSFRDDAGLRALIERAGELRATADREAAQALAAKRYTALLLRLNGLFYGEPWLGVADDAPAAERAKALPEFAADVLSRRHRKVVKRGKEIADLDAAGLHRLRIEIKKLRYAAEFFSSLYERKAVRGYTGALAQLQELLGSLNDAATVERLCERLRDGREDASSCAAVGIVRGWAAAGARDHLAQLPKAWARFKDADKF